MVRSSLARPASAFGPGGRPDGSAHGRHTAQLSAPLTVERLNSWHRQLFKVGARGLQSFPVGVLHDETMPMQGVSGDIGREQVHSSTIAHLWFVTFHPCEDGNGRLARALTERVLVHTSRAEVNTSPW